MVIHVITFPYMSASLEIRSYTIVTVLKKDYFNMRYELLFPFSLMGSTCYKDLFIDNACI